MTTSAGSTMSDSGQVTESHQKPGRPLVGRPDSLVEMSWDMDTDDGDRHHPRSSGVIAAE